MKVSFPIQRKEIKDWKIKKEKSYIEFDIDVSLLSQMRYESKFPELAKNEDLYGYSDRIFKSKELTTGKILSELKLLYCWINTDISFVDFVKLFDLTDMEYVKEFLEVLEKTFKLILEDTSSEKN